MSFRPSRFRLAGALLVCLVVVVASVLFVFREDRASISELLRDAVFLAEQGDLQQAEVLALRAARRGRRSIQAVRLAADAAAQSGRLADAVRYCDLIDEQYADEFSEAQGLAGYYLVQMHRLSEAEIRFRRVLKAVPEHSGGLTELVWLLNVTGRRWEAVPLLETLLVQDQITLEQLTLLSVYDAALDDTSLLEQAAVAAPDDPLPHLGLARLAMQQQKLDRAEGHLEHALALSPDLIGAQALRGQILARTGSSVAFQRWNASLSETADKHPEIWIARGIHCERVQRPREAVRCYLETIRLVPNHQLAAVNLGRLLASVGDESAGAAFAAYAEQLIDLAGRVHHVRRSDPDARLLIDCGRLTETMRRLPEASAWFRLASELSVGASQRVARDASMNVARLSSNVTASTPVIPTDATPLSQMDVSQWPLPDNTPLDVPSGGHRIRDSEGSRIRFVDDSYRAGLETAYSNGRMPDTPPLIHHSTGSGVAVLDYDGDGRSDLWFTQGNRLSQSQAVQRDQLMRNVSDRLGPTANSALEQSDDRLFEDVTLNAHAIEDAFSQGVAVGDINNDGFSDLYIANFEANRLLINLGDGTFEDASGQLPDFSDWATSCAIADLNGDSAPDIYDVNYLVGPDLTSRTCRHADGTTFTCPPRYFSGAPDRILLSRGDGTFDGTSAPVKSDHANGKGLGLVVADFDQSGRLSVFVANDEVPNSLLRNAGATQSAVFFQEEALQAGVAVDASGRPNACMGIAAADITSDGLIDLFVTNFSGESNVLYLQQTPGLFIDHAAGSGLSQPSLAMVGFGTQFLDADLDGIQDLVVANGHLDEARDPEPFGMQAQFFQGKGDAAFVELTAEDVGEFFAQPRVGRALARLDWDRNGLPDLVVTYLNESPSLVTNQTVTDAHWLSLECVGTVSSREPVGTHVTVTAAGRTWSQQLTAGDGYQASNERLLHFGLGSLSKNDGALLIERIEIRWPSGRVPRHNSVETNRHFLATEDGVFFGLPG